jgi:hypothetical protein
MSDRGSLNGHLSACRRKTVSAPRDVSVSKWKALPDLTAAQRAAVVGYEAALAQLRQVNSDVLATADQLTRTAIEAVLAKSDLELGLEALLRGWQ